MAYKILYRKPEAMVTQIVAAIKNHQRLGTEQAMFSFRELESKIGEVLDNSLQYVLEEFYQIEHIPTEAELYWQKVHEPYTATEEEDALAWFETLTEEQKRHVEVLKYVKPVFTGPIG